jgi:hypothetical protein
VHGTTNCKGDSPTFAVSMATPVILARIVRLTADGTEFCGGVVVLAAGEIVGDLIIGGKKPLHLKADLNRRTCQCVIPKVVAKDLNDIVMSVVFQGERIQQWIAEVGPIRSDQNSAPV